MKLSQAARLLYIALWCEADREGRLVWRPGTFKLRYFPADKVNIEALCKELTGRRLIVLYGDGYAHIPTFSQHQHVNPREAQSTLPVPTDASVTRDDASNLDMHAQVGREGKEGKGKEGVDDASGRVVSPPQVDETPILEKLPLRDGSEFPVRQSLVSQLEPLYPSVDVSATVKEMKGWLLLNADRRKTKAGIKRFIGTWLQNEQAKHGG